MPGLRSRWDQKSPSAATMFALRSVTLPERRQLQQFDRMRQHGTGQALGHPFESEIRPPLAEQRLLLRDTVHTLARDEVSALRRLKADSTSPFVFVSERAAHCHPT